MTIYYLLKKKFKKKFLFNFFILLFAASLEFLSFAAFLPALIILFKKDTFIDYNYFNFIYIYLNFSNHYIFLIFCLLFVCFIYFVKNIFLGFAYWLNIRLASDIQIYLSNLLLNNYLNKPYIFFTNINSSKIIRNVLSEISVFTRSYLLAIFNILLEVLVFAFILLIIFSVNYKITILVFSYFITISVLLYFKFKSYSIKWGTERLSAENIRQQCLQEAISGIKEVKIFSLENFFLNKFSYYNKIAIVNFSRIGYITQLPRLFFEFLIVSTVFLIFLINFYLQKPIEEGIYIISLFAVASFRIFPGINKIFINLNMLNYSKASVKLIKDELLNVHAKNKILDSSFFDLRFKKNTKINFNKVNYIYPKQKKQIITNMNLTINHGSAVALIGKTGSGKSTILNLLTGMLNPKNGNIMVDNINVSDNPTYWRKFISYVPQTPFFIDDTILKNITLGIDLVDINYSKLNHLLELTDLKDFISKLPEGLHTHVGENAIKISGGQKQRIAICRALYRDPKILILDEATNALDFHTENRVLKNLISLKGNMTIMIVSHKIKDVDFDEIYEVKNGYVKKII
jgi:ABC-type bacteriocin/lantibiotic exporter with double-glycine peptidase domain